MKLIVGLGNPGSRYDATRHNAGKSLVEWIADSKALRFSKKSSLKAAIICFNWKDHSVGLAYPETFMNVSGEAVRLLVEHFEINIKIDLLIVVDDSALPFGRLRLRSRGTDGGHNGLKSVERALGTSAYPRLRLGVGSPDPAESLEDYVLSSFSSDEKHAFPEFIERGAKACELWVARGIAAAMNHANDGTRNFSGPSS